MSDNKTMRSLIYVSLVMLIGILTLSACGTEDADDDQIGAAVDYTITGIEPGAGTMDLAANTLEEYDNLDGYELEEASTAAMISALNSAIADEEPVIVTGWTPHWKFAMHDLKFLEDPKETFGGLEEIHTLTRLELSEDMPEAYTILDRFYWEPEDMEYVMLLTAEEDMSFEEAANDWIADNESMVEEWTDGVDMVDGDAIELVATPWDTERASAAVVAEVLTRQGYDVEITPVDPSVMFQALATGDADASAAAWLPATHEAFLTQHEGEIDELGANLEGARIGFVVPEYVDIDSIEDLEPVE
ncbi:glycine betaine/proline transport system substrate-binding protein [Pelagirhabdus alkalitolerans]|uniref:Glycine betaine/proline transport system substrate-binding protein n=1 Tax=Pelagirhabdus alkalitolerans TaxID=1612202 RepID=A0A1G6NBR4_9BACI|nr:glycine betaine ABC transporter substrate-binding protein [Pelagirhabdus alkalitolerans]SDC65270.1 glycine betaine/proline transport system substrate-binding protein [Pelagirhabdus alkalitolerans]